MKIKEILDWLDEDGVDYEFRGEDSTEINGFSSLVEYKYETITWLKNKKVLDEVSNISKISCAVVEKTENVDLDCMIIVEGAKAVFFSIVKKFWGNNTKTSAIGQGTVISDQVEIGSMVNIGCNCSLIGEISIGDGTVIEHNVVIQGNVRVGSNCLIHSGAVIGGDGFGYYFDDDGKVNKVDHFGGVIIGDEVEIGSNACIDRGTIDCTSIGTNTKIDNLVHIAHNVKIGKNVCVVAGAIICGSVKLNDGSYVAPGAVVKNQVNVGENALVGIGGVVLNDVPKEMVVVGVPAVEKRRIRHGDK